MPLMRPEIQAVLRASGLDKSQTPSEGSENAFSEKLNRAGLSQDHIAEELSDLARGSESPAIRLRALEIGMRAQGILKETAQVAIPSFTIVIQQTSSDKTNDILFPRQSLGLTQLQHQQQKEN